jgi:hypothetical protein
MPYPLRVRPYAYPQGVGPETKFMVLEGQPEGYEGTTL